MSSSTISSPQPNPNISVVIPVRICQEANTDSVSITPNEEYDDDDDELSDKTIARLLREAESRMTLKSTGGQNPFAIRLPKLDPGASLPKPPINTRGSIAKISDNLMLTSQFERELVNTTRSLSTNTNKKSTTEQPPTAGAAWFGMPRTELTTEFKRDFSIIKHRNVLDPHRHYRKDKSGIPEYSQMGTIIEGNTEFFNSRINKKDRHKTILEEVLADSTSRERFKRKYHDIQKGKKSGRKEFYRQLQEQRKKTKFV